MFQLNVRQITNRVFATDSESDSVFPMSQEKQFLAIKYISRQAGKGKTYFSKILRFTTLYVLR